MSIIFTVDREVKEEFLESKPTATANAESFVLRSADRYEALIDKSIYNMTHSELWEMLLMQFKNSSENTIKKNVSILKTYIDFCISKNIVIHGENRLATFSAEDAKDFVHRQALINRFISKKQLDRYINTLYNEQDQALIKLVYTGVRGRPSIDGTMEEVINLRISDLDEENKLLIVRQNDGRNRVVEVDYQTIELIKDAYNQKVYVENNGEKTQNTRVPNPREIQINRVEDFVFCVPGQKKMQKFTPSLLNSRIRRIQKWVGNMYLTWNSLYMSAMIQALMDIEETRDVTKEDIIKICDKFNYGWGQPDRYWFNVKSMFETYRELLK